MTDSPFQFPLGAAPTGPELAAANEVLRIDFIQLSVVDFGGMAACTFSLGIADPGGSVVGFAGPRLSPPRIPGLGFFGQLTGPFHVPGIDMEFTRLECDARIASADIQVYYTRVPRTH